MVRGDPSELLGAVGVRVSLYFKKFTVAELDPGGNEGDRSVFYAERESNHKVDRAGCRMKHRFEGDSFGVGMQEESKIRFQCPAWVNG